MICQFVNKANNVHCFTCNPSTHQQFKPIQPAIALSKMSEYSPPRFWKCPACQEEISGPIKIRKHITKAHVCLICKDNFLDEIEMTNHIHQPPNPAPFCWFYCFECGKNRIDRSPVKNLKNITYLCTVCNESTTMGLTKNIMKKITNSHLEGITLAIRNCYNIYNEKRAALSLDPVAIPKNLK